MFLTENKQNEDFSEKYLSVWLHNSLYCFKLDYVTEIIPMVEISNINLADNVLGLINLRGENIPVYSMNFTSGNLETNITNKQKLLIIRCKDKKNAIIIDKVGDIINIEKDKISEFSSNDNIDFLQSTVIDNKTSIIVDIEKFFEKDIKNHNLTVNFPAVTDEKIKNRTKLMSQSSSNSILEESFFNEKFIVFELSSEIYAFNISYIKEIKKIDSSAINKIPCVPDFIKGIINFRGDYISLIDVKPFLNMEIGSVSAQPDVIVCKINNMKIAILVDSIIDVTNLPISNMNSENISESFVIGEISYNDMLINMLNVEKLFSAENVNIENYD